jgi:hypothetical protein
MRSQLTTLLMMLVFSICTVALLCRGAGGSRKQD